MGDLDIELADNLAEHLGNSRPHVTYSSNEKYPGEGDNGYGMNSLVMYLMYKRKGGDANDDIGLSWFVAFLSELFATFVFVFLVGFLFEWFTVTFFFNSITNANSANFPVLYGVVVALAYILSQVLFGKLTAELNPTQSLIDAFLPHSWAKLSKSGGYGGMGWALLLASAKIVGQLVGSIAAGALIQGFTPHTSFTFVNGGLPGPITDSAAFPSIPVGIIFLAEFLGTTFFYWVYLVTTWDQRTSRSYIYQGITLGVLSMVFIEASGGSFNFARYFGPAIFVGFPSTWWAYLVGPLLGQIVAALLWYFVFRFPSLAKRKELRKAD